MKVTPGQRKVFKVHRISQKVDLTLKTFLRSNARSIKVARIRSPWLSKPKNASRNSHIELSHTIVDLWVTEGLNLTKCWHVATFMILFSYLIGMIILQSQLMVHIGKHNLLSHKMRLNGQLKI